MVLAILTIVGDSVYDDNAPEAGGEDKPQSAAFLPYAVSTLSPRIVPNDLTSFKSRGVSKVQKDTAQRLAELKEQYDSIVNEFNWNKLVYESDFRFEPVIGEVYHLYWADATHSGVALSMVSPGEWAKEHIASLQLGFDGRWIPQEVAEGFDLQDALAILELDSGATSENDAG